MRKSVFYLLLAAMLLLCFVAPQVVQAATVRSSDDVEIDIPIGCAHSYGSWSSSGNGTHRRTCTSCDDVQIQTCAWDSGTVTKTATCKEEGLKNVTCTVCNSTKTEKIPRSTTHTPDSEWFTDEKGHWRLCTVCDETIDQGFHDEQPALSETSLPYCGVCGREMGPGFGHVHDYSIRWTTSETGHWHTCSGCEVKDSYGTHAFENSCDTDCTVCGHTRSIEHTPADSWKSDAKTHWKICSICGQNVEKTAHTPGEAATVTTAQTCTVCSYELAPVIGSQQATDEPTAPTEVQEILPEEETQPEKETEPEQQTSADTDFSWWLLMVPLFTAAAIVVLIFVLRRRK